MKEGDIVSVTCLTIGGTQPIVFSWKKDDRELSPSQNIPQVNIENSPVVSVLILSGVTINSDGNYSCAARNSYGSSTYSSTLKVKGKLVNILIEKKFYYEFAINYAMSSFYNIFPYLQVSICLSIYI